MTVLAPTVLPSGKKVINVIIFTVSSIAIIPIVYWSVARMGGAYAQMMRKQTAENIPIEAAVKIDLSQRGV